MPIEDELQAENSKETNTQGLNLPTCFSLGTILNLVS